MAAEDVIDSAGVKPFVFDKRYGFGRPDIEADPNVSRIIICEDAISWLNNYEGYLPGSVFTSLPDISEISNMFEGHYLEKLTSYREWFINAVALVCSKVKPTECVIFLQSDVRVIADRTANENKGMVVDWIDKSALCTEGVRRFESSSNGHPMKHMWHKICLVRALAAKSMGRPAYSHLVCFSGADLEYASLDFVTPDVFERGLMVWPKGIGLNAGLIGVNFIHNIMKSDCLIDPFCGHATVLALAEAVGIKKTIGIEISIKRCRKAKVLDCRERLKTFPSTHLRLYGCSNEQIRAIQAYIPVKMVRPAVETGDCSSSSSSSSSSSCPEPVDNGDYSVDYSLILSGDAALPKTEEEEEEEDRKADDLICEDL